MYFFLLNDNKKSAQNNLVLKPGARKNLSVIGCYPYFTVFNDTIVETNLFMFVIKTVYCM